MSWIGRGCLRRECRHGFCFRPSSWEKMSRISFSGELPSDASGRNSNQARRREILMLPTTEKHCNTKTNTILKP